MTAIESVLVWFRRDLRIDDQTALSCTLRDSPRLYCAFVFDTEILGALPRGGSLHSRTVADGCPSAARLRRADRGDYPAPIVSHDRARKIALELFGRIRRP